MRLWTIHPKYLDTKGLVASWREGLLAQKCLLKETKGYQNHPQLDRFKSAPDSIAAIGFFLYQLFLEAQRRHYNFDQLKIKNPDPNPPKIATTDQQLLYEWKHFLVKVKTRSPKNYNDFKNIVTPDPHPLFEIVSGPIEPWEKF